MTYEGNEALYDGRVRPRFGLIPVLLVLRGLTYGDDPGRTSTGPSGSRLVSGSGAPRGMDRLVFIFLATLARLKGNAIEFSARAIVKMFGLTWSAAAEREALLRVVDSVFYRPAHARDCPCACRELAKGARVVDDFQYCEVSDTYRIRLSDEFMDEVEKGAPVLIDDLIRLAPSPAVMDLYMWMILRANSGRWEPVRLKGEAGMMEFIRSSPYAFKAQQDIVKRFRTIQAEFWRDTPYVYDAKEKVARCRDGVDPREALARFLDVKDLDALWASPRSRASAESSRSDGRRESPEPERRQTMQAPRAVAHSSQPARLASPMSQPSDVAMARQRAASATATASASPPNPASYSPSAAASSPTPTASPPSAAATSASPASAASPPGPPSGELADADRKPTGQPLVRVGNRSDNNGLGVLDSGQPTNGGDSSASNPDVPGDVSKPAGREAATQQPDPASPFAPFVAELTAAFGLSPGENPAMQMAIARVMADQLARHMFGAVAQQLVPPAARGASTG